MQNKNKIILYVLLAAIAVFTVTFTIIRSPKPARIMAWIYPGKPACNAETEYSDGRKIDTLKSEYFLLSKDGVLTQLNLDTDGCNAYSPENVTDLKKYSSEQYVTVSSSGSDPMNIFIDNSRTDPSEVNTLINFVKDNGFAGVELDFEGYSKWSGKTYANYKDFILSFGTALHAAGKKLIIDGPAMAGKLEEDETLWRYSDFSSLPLDGVIVLSYDYEVDHGIGNPISPFLWLKQVTEYVESQFPDHSKIIMGIPSYGYKAVLGDSDVTVLTLEQLQMESGFQNAHRDKSSGEMTWTDGQNVYFYQDPVTMTKKLKLLENLGISTVSVWHLGGNPWFLK